MKTVFIECERILTSKEYKMMQDDLNAQVPDDVKIVLLGAGMHVVPHGIIEKFRDYQIAWLKSHNDIELEPQTEELITGFIRDTANSFEMGEYDETKNK
jgi:hypothetical protein